jgi:hypothetical protein
MKANLLLVSNDDFPVGVSDYFKQHEFSCFFARGRLKIKEIFNHKKMDTIVWLFRDYDEGLASDLIKAFNEQDSIPLILITEAYGDSDLSEIVAGVYAHHDINDNLSDIRNSIESACNLTEENISNEPARINLPEIDFKNAVRHLITESSDHASDVDDSKGKLVIDAPWSAVSKKEKNILSNGFVQQVEKSVFKKIWENFRGKK